MRVGLGILFIVHGWQKLGNPEAVAGFFGSLGLGGVGMVIFVGLVQFVGGIMLLLGVCTRYASILLSIVMLVAIVKVHWDNGYSGQGGYEYQLLILLATLGILFSGPGRYALLKDKSGHKCADGTCCAHKD